MLSIPSRAKTSRPTTEGVTTWRKIGFLVYFNP
jgi:hypothetical protein